MTQCGSNGLHSSPQPSRVPDQKLSLLPITLLRSVRAPYQSCAFVNARTQPKVNILPAAFQKRLQRARLASILGGASCVVPRDFKTSPRRWTLSTSFGLSLDSIRHDGNRLKAKVPRLLHGQTGENKKVETRHLGTRVVTIGLINANKRAEHVWDRTTRRVPPG